MNGGIESDTQAVVMSVTGNQAIYVASRMRGGAASLYIVHRCIGLRSESSDEKENEPGGIAVRGAEFSTGHAHARVRTPHLSLCQRLYEARVFGLGWRR